MLDYQLDENKDNFSRIRTMTLEDGDVLSLERHDPHGLIKIKSRKGTLPEMLRGEYTGFPQAEKDISQWLNSKNKKVKIKDV